MPSLVDGSILAPQTSLRDSKKPLHPQKKQGRTLPSWPVNLLPPNVHPQKEGLIKGLLTIGFPQEDLIKPLFLGGGYVRGGRLTSHNFNTGWFSSSIPHLLSLLVALCRDQVADCAFLFIWGKCSVLWMMNSPYNASSSSSSKSSSSSSSS